MSTRRLFVDPGSKSCGWAIFEGTTLIRSGTIVADPIKDGDVAAFRRICTIARKFHKMAEENEEFHYYSEVHLEKLVRNTHYYTHWSVGAIGAALAFAGIKVYADIPIRKWQLYCGWRKADTLEEVKVSLPRLKKVKVDSIDELAACGMGFYYTKNVAR